MSTDPKKTPTGDEAKAAEAAAAAAAAAKAKAEKPKTIAVVTLVTTLEKDANGKDVYRPPGRRVYDEETANDLIARKMARLPKARSDDDE